MSKLTDVYNFADDAIFHVVDSSLEDLVITLEHDASLAIELLDCNFMKLNEDKCHLIISGHKSEAIWAKIGQTEIWESKKQKLLGVVNNSQLSVDKYIILLCQKAGKS